MVGFHKLTLAMKRFEKAEPTSSSCVREGDNREEKSGTKERQH